MRMPLIMQTIRQYRETEWHAWECRLRHPAPAQTSSVTSDKWLNLSVPQFPHLQNRIRTVLMLCVLLICKALRVVLSLWWVLHLVLLLLFVFMRWISLNTTGDLLMISSTHSFIDSFMLQALLLYSQVSELLWLRDSFSDHSSHQWGSAQTHPSRLSWLMSANTELLQPVPTSDQRLQLSFPGSGCICREKVTQMRPGERK